MRRLIAIGLLGVMITAVCGAEQLSVAQLEQRLDASLKKPAPSAPDHAKTDTFKDVDIDVGNDLLRDFAEDNDLARQLYLMELTERLTPKTFARILAKDRPGPEVARALAFLEDRSAFLDPPQGEWAALPAPDAESQKHALELARGYVFQTLLRLPNFFATRTTERLETEPPTRGVLAFPNQEAPHLAGKSVLEITFRDGKEFEGPTEAALVSKTPAAEGLASEGEFGTEAAIVLVDLEDQANGTAAFHHWETTATGPAAVYRYAVAAGGSHYEVRYACKARTAFHEFPGYHGSIAINQATGAILRITVAADWKPGNPVSHVTSAIEYGPVKIGDRVYICPVQSIAFMIVEANACRRLGGAQRLADPVITMNRTTFNNYHRLGSTVRILPPEKDEKQGPG
jgi:hypothetical protein